MKERIVSLGILVFALTYLAGSLSLKVGTLAQPGAGQFPAVVAFFLVGIAAFHAWRTLKKTLPKEEGHRWTQLAPAGIAAVLIFYPILLKTLSFLISTFIVIYALFRLLRFRTAMISFLTALFTTLLAFIVFTGLLGVTLPNGFIERFILKSMGFD